MVHHPRQVEQHHTGQRNQSANDAGAIGAQRPNNGISRLTRGLSRRLTRGDGGLRGGLTRGLVGWGGGGLARGLARGHPRGGHEVLLEPLLVLSERHRVLAEHRVRVGGGGARQTADAAGLGGGVRGRGAGLGTDRHAV